MTPENSNLASRTRPRVCNVDLSLAVAAGDCEHAVHRAPWRGTTPAVDRVGRWSGSALALAILYEALTEHDAPAREDAAGRSTRTSGAGSALPLVLAVGDAVKRGIPTAVRTTIASRSPLTGALCDGQVGSDLARRLASATDALVLSGRTEVRGAVLHLARDGCFALHSFPELEGAGPRATHRAIVARLGPCETLRIGRAGEIGLPFASLAAGDDPPSLVGRGGLGAVFGALGLKALAIGTPPVELAMESEDGDRERASRDVARRLARSPRLVARADGGTLEIASALAARGELTARGGTVTLTDREAEGWIASAGNRHSHERKGCTGCPTPCGWVFDAPGSGDGASERRGGRFTALRALGFDLGLIDLQDTLALLEVCDEAVMDAREVGALLVLECRARERSGAPSHWGDRDALVALLGELLDPHATARTSFAGLASRGAASMARDLGLDPVAATPDERAIEAPANLAEMLGESVSVRGSAPMRTFPFLMDGAAGAAWIARALAPLELSERAMDPGDPTAKGRIVWWHENFLCAIDMTGFCAFSAAGLIGDGACEVDELARWIAPASVIEDGERADAGARPGRQLLEAGASIAHLQREINAHLAVRAGADPNAAAAASWSHPGMWPEYRRLRGLDEDGVLTRAARDRFAAGRSLEAELEIARSECEPVEHTARDPHPSGGERSEASRPSSVARGSIELHCVGPLAGVLGSRTTLEIDLPRTVETALSDLARDVPRAGRFLLREGELLPLVYRNAKRLAKDDWLRDGDRLDLVLALSGG